MYFFGNLYHLPDANNVNFGVRKKYNIFERLQTKISTSKMASNCILSAFFAQNFKKKSKISKNGAFGAISGASRPKIRKPCNRNPPSSGRNPAIETPLRGSETPLYLVIVSLYLERARTGSYASLPLGPGPSKTGMHKTPSEPFLASKH